MTIIIDDAGSGDLLWGIVIGAYRPESDIFIYDLIPVEHFQEPIYTEKRHFTEAALISKRLVSRLELAEKEKIQICQGNILDETAKTLREQYGDERVERVHIEGRAQHLIELAYLEELRNLGYEPLPDRTEKWGKSFRSMLEWVKQKPERVKWVKSGFPNIQRMKLFQKPGPILPQGKRPQIRGPQRGSNISNTQPLKKIQDTPRGGPPGAKPPQQGAKQPQQVKRPPQPVKNPNQPGVKSPQSVKNTPQRGMRPSQPNMKPPQPVKTVPQPVLNASILEEKSPKPVENTPQRVISVPLQEMNATKQETKPIPEVGNTQQVIELPLRVENPAQPVLNAPSPIMNAPSPVINVPEQGMKPLQEVENSLQPMMESSQQVENASQPKQPIVPKKKYTPKKVKPFFTPPKPKEP
jgi:hypothetical protein